MKKRILLPLAASLLTTVLASSVTWQPLADGWKSQPGDPAGAEALGFDDSRWTSSRPTEAVQTAATETTVWFRLHLSLPAEVGQSRSLLLHLGTADAQAPVYFNGVRLAGSRDAEERTVALVPALLVQPAADNVVAVKVTVRSGSAALLQPAWIPLASAVPALLERAGTKSDRLAELCRKSDPRSVDFLLAGLQHADFAQLQRDYAADSTDLLACTIAARWRDLLDFARDSERRLQEFALYRDGDLLGFMKDQQLYLVPDFDGDALRRPALGSELSDFGSWYDIGYSGGPNRFFVGSVRKGIGPDNEFFNTPRDVAQLALFLRTEDDGIVGADDRESTVAWMPYGWKTTTRHGGIELESATFFSAFNTLTVYGRVQNTGSAPITLRPNLLVAARSSYEQATGGNVVGAIGDHSLVTLQNTRVGPRTTPSLYTDTLAIGTDSGAASAAFVPRYFATARGPELSAVLTAASASALAAPAGSVLVQSGPLELKPGQAAEFSFVVAGAADSAEAVQACAGALGTAPAKALATVEADWNGFLTGLPALARPNYAAAKLYYTSAIALRKNHLVLPQEGRLYDASFPARGGFNYFYQSDSCWNLLGYLDFHPAWAKGHATPILVPTCEIMDPHFFWSMWEVYSRLPDPVERRAFAAEVYPLLQQAYRLWTTKLEIDGDLLVATPNNWDDNPRYDLIFKEVKYAPGWNSWWNDLVACCREHQLHDPAPSSQLGYGPVVLERLARILGRATEADDWARLIPRHQHAVDTLWDEARGYWIVTYRGTQRDEVLTSSILYPVFTGMCRDPQRIRRVVERHLLNPAEFAGEFPVPTVAYDDARFYRQKPPFDHEPGGLWRGNIWMPEAWVIVKGLFKYGYEREADVFARRLLTMMARQTDSVGAWPQMRFSPAEWYDARTGLAQNNRAFSWSSAVALDFLLGNYQNERVLGTNPERDRTVVGHLRELFAFDSGRSLFRVETVKSVFPLLTMQAVDGKPIEQSSRVEFAFTDPAHNFAGTPIRFTAAPDKWRIVDGADQPLQPDASGAYTAAPAQKLVLLPLNPNSANDRW